jgi:hypothetical protein
MALREMPSPALPSWGIPGLGRRLQTNIDIESIFYKPELIGVPFNGKIVITGGCNAYT